MTTETIDPSVQRGAATPTRREESAALARITAPLAAAFIAEMAMSVTDTVIVGYLGSVQLGAVGLTANIVFTGLTICIHILSIVGVLVAQNHAAGDDAAAAHAVRMGFWVATMAAVPAIFMGWTVSGNTALIVAAYFAVQQFFENNLLVPRIMERQVGVSAVTVLVALLIGSELLGIVGALLAVPSAAIVQVLIQEFVISDDA